jgi:hypothetical protein
VGYATVLEEPLSDTDNHSVGLCRGAVLADANLHEIFDTASRRIRDGSCVSAVSTNGTDLRLEIKEGLGFVVVTKERRKSSGSMRSCGRIPRITRFARMASPVMALVRYNVATGKALWARARLPSGVQGCR